MVIIKLQCELGHAFEGWFKNKLEYKRQMTAGLVDCPECGCNLQLNSPAKNKNIEFDGFSVVSHQEIKMISEQFIDDLPLSVDDTFDFGESYSESVQQETKDFSEDGISSISIKMEDIEKDKLN